MSVCIVATVGYLLPRYRLGRARCSTRACRAIPTNFNSTLVFLLKAQSRAMGKYCNKGSTAFFPSMPKRKDVSNMLTDVPSFLRSRYKPSNHSG